MALTSPVMKAMETVIKNHIINATDSQIDPRPVLHTVQTGVDGAKAFITTARLLDIL